MCIAGYCLHFSFKENYCSVIYNNVIFTMAGADQPGIDLVNPTTGSSLQLLLFPRFLPVIMWLGFICHCRHRSSLVQPGRSVLLVTKIGMHTMINLYLIMLKVPLPPSSQLDL